MKTKVFEATLPPLSESERQAVSQQLAQLHTLLNRSHQKELQDLAEDILNWFTHHIGAIQGVFWQVREEGEAKELTFSAGFACTPEKKIAISEGVYHAVLKDGEVIFQTQLEGLQYTSATYQIPLRSWLILPIKLNERLLAALEFFHPTTFSASALHLLWQSLPFLAATWSGAIEQAERKILIKRLHQQNDEIRVQEEELRQHTEELLAINENLEQVKYQLERKNLDLQETKTLIEEKNKNITASIQYAKRIQQSTLPSATQLNTHLRNEPVLLFLPRDIVSGDFYWTHQNAQGTWIAAVDCTGHGVPAALLGMMGMNILEHIMSSEENLCPAQVLHYLDKRVSHNLGNANDGMDMALCLLDFEAKKIHYSGAMNPAYYVSESGLIRLPHTRKPIGGSGLYHGKYSFENHSLSMKGNGMLYLCSDGFQDQFGGEKNKKFMRRRFLKLLEEIWPLPAKEQSQVLHQRLTDWKGKENQTDDVLVLGVRV